MSQDNTYDVNRDLEYFRSLWRARGDSPVPHSPEIWDRRAEEWISDLGDADAGKRESLRADTMHDRVRATAAYLRGRGLLTASETVVDIGCGPGLFVAEFAKTAKHATGMDYSARFMEFAAEHAASRGVTNADFQTCDFLALDVAEAKLERSYDLVFTSITPAASGHGCLEKLIAMSRAYCYNASFVHTSDELVERVSQDVFGVRRKPRLDGAGFYALLNLLWFMGYYPETSYYEDARDEIIPATYEAAERIASRCGAYERDDILRVQSYLEKHGATPRHSVYRYGGVLWDVRVRDTRN
ncbi:MAG: methyltransferase domain-containing protein [Oscillospiraceae bacterium]|jgi:SAM-dependent methyltransferase|nr:methyltransferase domain-containing protein [Oscillospiraceae bacterium]